jgi:hypothetical protein
MYAHTDYLASLIFDKKPKRQYFDPYILDNILINQQSILTKALAILGGGMYAHTDYLASLQKKPKRQYFDPLNQQSILTKAFAILVGGMYTHTDHLASLIFDKNPKKTIF